MQPRAEAQGSSPGLPNIAPTLVFWIVAQLLLLMACASRTSLWLHQAPPYENAALAVVSAMQIVLISLLAPLLLACWSRTFATLVATLPFILFASMLSAVSMSATLRVGAIESGWIFIVAIAIQLRPQREYRALITAVASLYAIGGTLLGYTSREFTTSTHPITARWSPLLLILRPISHVSSLAKDASAFSTFFLAMTIFFAGYFALGEATAYPHATRKSCNPTS